MTTKGTWPTELTPAVYEELTKPFGAHELEVRVGATTGPDNEKRGLAIPYTDANSIRNRLDCVVGAFNWSFTPSQWRVDPPVILTVTNASTGNVEEKVDGQRVVVWGELKIFDVVRVDCGEGYKEDESFKSAVTDAFKRAATAFGFGRELYSLPRPVWAPVKSAGRGWVFVDPAAVRQEIAVMCCEMDVKGHGIAEAKTGVTTVEKEETTERTTATTASANGKPGLEQLASIRRLRKQYFGSDADGDTTYRNQLEKNYGVRSSKFLSIAQANGLQTFLKGKTGKGEVYNPNGHQEVEEAA